MKKSLFALILVFAVLFSQALFAAEVEAEIEDDDEYEVIIEEDGEEVVIEDNSEEKTAVLIVSFGTSDLNAQKAIDNLLNSTKKEFPSFDVRLSFSSKIIRKKILEERGQNIPSPAEALAKLNDEDFTHVVIMPTYMIPGEEFDDLKELFDGFGNFMGKYGFDMIDLAMPFLSCPDDCERMAEIIYDRFKPYLSNKSTGIVLMGHGTPDHLAQGMYSQLQLALNQIEYGRFFIGTVEASPTIDNVLDMLDQYPEITNLLLSPLMIVAGDHASNDLAKEDSDESWISILREAGYKNIETYLVGLGEDKNIVHDFLEKIHDFTD